MGHVRSADYEYRVHSEDHDTSIEGAEDVAGRAPNQQQRLLDQWTKVAPGSLTDEEAADLAGLERSCYWKRCGELRRAGLIEYDGSTRTGAAGVSRKTSRLV